jgi:Sulfotransferase family
MPAQKVRFPDLRDPVLSDLQRQHLEQAERNPVEMSVEAVLSAASARAGGLDDFGPDDFLERLRLNLDEFASDPGNTELIKAGLWSRSVRFATTRLLVLDLLERHPEIHDEEIEKPFVTGGLPRSGTTHLQNLLAADSRLHSLPFWEASEPLPLPGEPEGPAGVDPRWLRSEAGWRTTLALNPYMAYHHPMPPDHISEDGELQSPDFGSYAVEWMYAPRWREHYLTHDQTPHYEFQKTMMKVLQWRRGDKKRWVVKSPQHIEQLRAIVAVFPDATIVLTHRDPVGSLQSTMFGHAYRTRLARKHPGVQEIVDYWVPRYPVFLERYLDQRDAVPDGRLVDLRFDEFVRDNMAAMEQVYEAADLELTDRARAEIEACAAENRRHKAGSIDHDLRRDFGLDPTEVRRSFDFYLERMPVPDEVV